MNIWRLISFHEEDSKQQIVQNFIQQSTIAIGWGNVGPLNQFSSSNDIGQAIRNTYQDSTNSNIGGPSLWHMYKNIQFGDFIIIDAQKKWNVVVEVIGNYEWNNEKPNVTSYHDYYHQRKIKLRNDIDPTQLMKITGTRPAQGQSAQLVLFYYGSFSRILQF